MSETPAKPAKAATSINALPSNSHERRAHWHASRIETAIEPELPIVDPHHHLWDRGGHTYLLPQWLAETDCGHRIEASVYVECQSMYREDGPEAQRPLGEVEFVNGIAAMSASGGYGGQRLCAGIVGRADLSLGAAVRPVLEAQIAAGGGRLKGIRYAAAWDGDTRIHSSYAAHQGLLAEPAVRAGLRELADLGLSFDAWLYHPQIDDVSAMADALPTLPIVLDHVGAPLGIFSYADRRTEVFEVWRRAIIELARRPNVVVKLGGLGMRLGGFGFHDRERPPSSEELADAWRPYVMTCIEAFGPQRCMFESNYPADSISCSYGVMWNAFKRLAAGASAGEKASLFAGTARSVYRLGGAGQVAAAGVASPA